MKDVVSCTSDNNEISGRKETVEDESSMENGSLKMPNKKKNQVALNNCNLNGNGPNGSCKEIISEKGERHNENITSPTTPTQNINAFQYMMNNRHKSIGTNSPGKEMDLANCEDHANKKQLRVRKALLESWSELKGASKRKRKYDEEQVCINKKLENRAKKLKKMLKISSHSDDELIVIKKRKCAKIESDDESGGCITINESEKPKKKGRRHKERRSLNNTKNSISDDGDFLENHKLPKKRSSQQWKIKIKLNPEKVESRNIREEKENSLLLNEEIEDKDELSTSKVECSNGHDNNKMVLRTRKPALKLSDQENLDVSDEEWEPSHKKKKCLLKVAPVFLKASSKPKLDPELVEARRQFLFSGIPESLKKEKEKQLSIEEIQFDLFPAISHVQQKTEHIFWNLPKVNIDQFLQKECTKFDANPLFAYKTATESSQNFNYQSPNLHKSSSYKNPINVIKSRNPSYPVNKIFKSLYSKSGCKVEIKSENSENVEKKIKSPPKRRGCNKKNSTNKNVEIIATDVSEPKIEESFSPYAMWTEKYKPKSSQDTIGNRKSVCSLKDWLTNWLTIINENKKIRRSSYDSESEFDLTDSDGKESTKSYNNTIILKGPHGSGKTSAVYAVCTELGLNVLEVNASSKRTGKRLLQELQEATQSHQVPKKEKVLSLVNDKKNQKSTKQKTCVLLVEDIDLVFDQDEGFITALMHIMATSKRPIILTTTDETALNLQKIVTNHKSICFAPLSSILSVWLQIVCLIEGCYVNAESLKTLLNYYKGDMRRTLLQLQFWVSSGRQMGKNDNNNDAVEIDTANSELTVEDDNSNMSDLKLEESVECNGIALGHSVDVCSLEVMESWELFSLPQESNLEVVWWNLPILLNLPNFSNFRLNPDRDRCCEDSEIDKVKEKQKLNSLSKFYDSLAFADAFSDRDRFYQSLERLWCIKPKNSIGLEELVSDYNDLSFKDNLANTFLGGHIKLHKQNCGSTYSAINMSVPSTEERRWHRKQVTCEEKLKKALLISGCLERRSIALDYMPALRSIVKSESHRALNTSKRRSRSKNNYLRNLGIYGDESMYKTACNVFKMQF